MGILSVDVDAYDRPHTTERRTTSRDGRRAQ